MTLSQKPAALMLAALLVAAGSLQCQPSRADRDNDLGIESRYITQCSCTEANATVKAKNISSAQPAYGVFNDWRIGNGQADFVRPGEAAIGSIGLLVGMHQLQTDGHSTADLDAAAHLALSGFFTRWLPNPANQIDKSDATHRRTGFPQQIAYSSGFAVSSKDADANPGVTAELLIAMAKYVQLSPKGSGGAYRQSEYDLAHRMADYVSSRVGSDHLVHDNYGNAYVADTSYAAAAFHAFAHWATAQADAQTAAYYDGQADAISQALATLQDPGPWHNYKRYKDAADSKPTYGLPGQESIDQTGFAPYEFDARPPGEPYGKAAADWWDSGRSWHQAVTQQSGPYKGGVHQQDYKSDARYAATPNARYLYAGSALQLAATEWKIARARGNDPALDARARAHYQFARTHGFWNADKHLDSYAGGFNDWVDPTTGAQQPETYKRFVDTSAYFIIATEMLEFSQDVDFSE